MTGLSTVTTQHLLPPEPRAGAHGLGGKKQGPPAIGVPAGSESLRSGHLILDTFSPVNQDGSFAYDRVLKSGKVHKRTRKTKQWKSFHLILRPNLLSLYKNPTEERLLKQITLSDLSAVAYLKDPKGRRDNLFGLYSPARNWHLQAQSAEDAKSWVELIKREARIDEEEQKLFLTSADKHQTLVAQEHPGRLENDRLGSSSPEPSIHYSTTTRDGVKIPGIRRLSAPSLDYSGDEVGPYSDFSDTPPQSLAQHSTPLASFVRTKDTQAAKQQQQPTPATHVPPNLPPPSSGRNASQTSGFHIDPHDNDRVLWHGFLLYLRSKGAVRQWKRTWAVLRPKHLAFYKNDEEYAAKLIIPLSNIISAVEIDPISKSKKYCMQIISEDRSYRFCAANEDSLAEWLGALKSQLVKRKEKEVVLR